jgi:hypothetical protein
MGTTIVKTMPRTQKSRIIKQIRHEQLMAKDPEYVKQQAQQEAERAGWSPKGKTLANLGDLDATGRLKVAANFLTNNKTGLRNLKPILPVMFNLNGKPFSIQDYFTFEPFYHTRISKNFIFKTARQLGKSQNQAAQGVLYSLLEPYFNTLFVTPLFEMIRRFSSNYVAPLISQSPIKPLMVDGNCTNSVLQRSFRNQSTLYFSFAFLNADRTRGLNAAKMVIDETVRFGTMVRTPLGPKEIQDFLPGDPVYSINETGHVEEDEVVTNSYHGYRNCFRIELEDGSFVDATGESYLRTASGWERVSTIIEALYRAANSDAAGDDAGRRKHAANEDLAGKPKLPKQPRLGSARLQPAKTQALVQVREQGSVESQERRLRRMVESMVDQELSRVAPYCLFVSPQREEVGNCDLALTADVGGDCLVVHGRRVSVLKESRELQHAGILGSGSGSADRLVGDEKDPLLQTRAHEPPQFQEEVLDDQFDGGFDLPFDQEDQTLLVSGDGLQSGFTAEERASGLCLLRRRSSLASGSTAVQTRRPQSAKELLPAGILLSDSEDDESQKVRTEIPGPDQRAIAEPLLRRSRSESEVPSRIHAGVRGKEQRRDIEKASVSPESGSRSEAATEADLRILPEHVRNEGTCESPVLLGRMQEGSQEDQPAEIRRQDSRLRKLRSESRQVQVRPQKIKRVSFLGKHHVFDIEVKKNHSFFANNVVSSNCQDLDISFIPIIKETMSGHPWGGISQYTGTPKTKSNTLNQLWRMSSQAEWVIKCQSCNYFNIPHIDHDLDAMTGPTHYNRTVSKESPGVVCAKCGRPINPYTGRWEHLNPELRWKFSGYHVPQFILPLHYASPEKWEVFIGKREGFGNTPPNVFYNECCGEAYDTGAALLTETDLKKAACLPWENTLEQAKANFNPGNYVRRIIGVDWGGGGMEMISLTSVAVLGQLPDGRIDVIYGWRSRSPHAHVEEARMILQLMKDFKCTHLAHDMNGAGSARETLIQLAGVPENRIIPISYVRFGVGPMMRFVKFNPNNGQRAHHRLDKSRSLVNTTQLISSGHIRFFKYDYQGVDKPGLLNDFLSLVEDFISSRTAADTYTIVRDERIGPDDFADAVNYAACAIFHQAKRWPDVAELKKIELPEDLLKEIHLPENFQWDM